MTDSADGVTYIRRDGDGWFTAFAVISGVAWAIAGVAAVAEYRHFNERRDSSRISAPQISQIADEFMVAMAPFVIVASGLTAIAILIGLARLVNRLAPADETVIVQPAPTTSTGQDGAVQPTGEVDDDVANSEAEPATSSRWSKIVANLIAAAAVGGLIAYVIITR